MSRVLLNTPAPDFTLPDFRGESFRLSDLAGKANVLLVFNRGFYWPFCRRQMAQLRQDHAEFERRSTRVIVIGPDSPKAFAIYWQKHDLPFTGLPDPRGSVLKLYGQEIKLFKLGRMPAQVIVDRAGLVRLAHYGESMEDIPENPEILAFLDALNQDTQDRT